MAAVFLSAHRAFTVLALTLVLGAGPLLAAEDEPVREGPVCDFPEVAFDASFEGGRLALCIQTGPRSYTLVAGPEDAPINPSAWYAFRVEAETPEPLNLTVAYLHGRHRYAPKLSRDGEQWAEVADAEANADGGSVAFILHPGDGPVWIAGQPLNTAEHAAAWLEGYAGRRDLVIETLGTSEEGREIRGLRTRARRAQTVFIVGRQHPPETTGALALEAFVDRLFAEDDLARTFRRSFSVHVIPVLNPDGVARGHWRHNSRGLDLNRDWGPFTQVETRLAARALQDATRGRPERLALFFDFHSTWDDVFYTQPDGAPGRRMDFSAAWIGRIDARLAEEGGGPPRNATHNPGLPTAKNWVYETYRAPAITFELGDATPPARIEAIAAAAAEEAMQLLLEDAP